MIFDVILFVILRVDLLLLRFGESEGLFDEKEFVEELVNTKRTEP